MDLSGPAAEPESEFPTIAFQGAAVSWRARLAEIELASLEIGGETDVVS
jgi:hypothetical protein